MLNFLQKVLAPTGFYCLSAPYKNGTGYEQVAFDSIEKMCELAVKWTSLNRDVYFAVGSMIDFIEPADRSASNIGYFKSFFLDIDCGEGKDYDTQKEGAEALKDFVTELGLPDPIMISSGYGVHAYWALTEEIPADRWLKIATRFKAITAHFGLRCDMKVTADRARILRVPNTINFKRGGQVPVTIRHNPEPYDLSDFTKPLATYFDANKMEVVAPKSKPTVDPLLAEFGMVGNLEENYPEAEFATIIKSCEAMKFAADHNDELSEPQWRDALSIAKHCIDADEAIHMVSENYADYSVGRTESKAASIPKPLKCATIAEDFEQCKTCTRGVTTPMKLGTAMYREVVVEIPKIARVASVLPSEDIEIERVEDDATGIDFMAVPYPFKRTEAGIVVDVEGDDGDDVRVMVCPYDIKYVGRIQDHFNKQDEAIFSMDLPKDGTREFQIPMGEMGDIKKVVSVFGSNGYVCPSNTTKHLGNFMTSYINSIVAKIAASKHYAQLGWNKDLTEFVLPTKVFKSDGTIEDCGMSKTVKENVKNFGKQGNLEDYVKIIDTYARDGFEAYAFGHSVGYGSLLLAFTDQTGLTVNLLGDSGSGKTTVQKTVNALFGHPELMLGNKRDTQNARYRHFSVMNSICFCIDEITNLEPDVLSEHCYTVSTGQDRGRLTVNSTTKEQGDGWKQISLTSANSGIYEKLSVLKSDAKAESMRVIEYHILTSGHTLTLDEARDIFAPLSQNYGHAGEVFIQYVVSHQAEVRECIAKWQKRFEQAVGIEVSERYWSSGCACTLAGAEISGKLALNHFNVESLFRFAVRIATTMRGIVREHVKDANVLLAEFINQHISNTLTLEGGKKLRDGSEQAWHAKNEPRGSLEMRIEHDFNHAFIARGTIRNWIIEGGSDFAKIKQELINRKILLNDNCQKVLSHGYPALRTGKVPCWMIDLSHPDLDALPALSIVNSKEVVAKVAAV